MVAGCSRAYPLSQRETGVPEVPKHRAETPFGSDHPAACDRQVGAQCFMRACLRKQKCCRFLSQ